MAMHVMMSLNQASTCIICCCLQRSCVPAALHSCLCWRCCLHPWQEYIAETQDEESFFPESSMDSGQLPQARAGRPEEMPAASEIRAMGPSLQDMPLRWACAQQGADPWGQCVERSLIAPAWLSLV